MPADASRILAAGIGIPAVAALGAAALIVVLRPLLVRYALARPNARSAHRTPTPQGGGIAVLIAAALAAILGALALDADQPLLDAFSWTRLATVLAAAALVALVGLVDDLRPLPPLPRLALQIIAVAIAVVALPDGARVLPFLPLVLERALLVLGGAWFVNLTNFMDGMDLLTVTEMAPVTGALSLGWFLGLVSAPAGLLMLGLFGGLLGFAPFNRPVARLFLGDVGSLPIGLLVAFGLYDLASHGALAAAILLPLYYIADSTLTLAWRLARGERVWEAHRHHFYQVAVGRGFAVRDVLARVLAANLVLVLLAGISVLVAGPASAILALALGAATVGLLLRDLARGRAVAAAQPAADKDEA